MDHLLKALALVLSGNEVHLRIAGDNNKIGDETNDDATEIIVNTLHYRNFHIK